MYTNTKMLPQTEEAGLEIITTAQISNQFSQESPYISDTFSRESPKFQTGFHRVSPPDPRPEGRGPRRYFDFSGRESTPEAKREKRVGGSGSRVGSSPTYKLPLANGSLPTPEARVGSCGAWQRPAQSGSSSAGLGSWGEFSRPRLNSHPQWYHERRAVAQVF